MNQSTYTESMKKFVQDHLREDPAQLLFRYSGKVDFDLKFTVQQIQARQKAKSKLPTWVANLGIVFPASLSLEQASSEETAKFKSKLGHGQVMIDLTGGFGVDTFFLSKHFEQAIYCERNGDLADTVRHNFNLMVPGKLEVVTGDSLEFFAKSNRVFDLTYVDPARRGEGNQKLYKLADCEPDVVGHWSLLRSKSKSILIKSSPMLDIKQAISEIPDIQQIWVVSVKNEVKEVLLFWERDASKVDRVIRAVDLHANEATEFSFTFEEEETSESIFGLVGKFLVEPNAAILKAGAFRSFGKRFGLKKLHPNSHLYTCDDFKGEMPGRVFEIKEEIKDPKKQLKLLFPDGKVNVITRNYALSADELKKKYRLSDGGDSFLIGTRDRDGFCLLICGLRSAY